MSTRAAYYTQRLGGVWRTARVDKRCDWKLDGVRCHHHIVRGEQYFDTNLPNPASSNEHAKYRICAQCANMEVLV